MADDIVLYADFAKVDEEQRTVFGYASTETRDQQGEIIRKDAIVAALPQYLRYPAVREMHQPSAVGTGIEAHVDEHGLWFGAKVIDDTAWKKVKTGVYRGFSMGGKITKRDPNDKSIATAIRLDEISLVDRPANPDAQFTLIKRAGDGLLHVQPTQCWACGVPGHQHVSKIECQSCIERQSLRQQARSNSGHSYATIDDIRDEAQYQAANFAKAADEFRLDARRHLEASLYAKQASDQITSAYHDVMAKSCSALASHHDSVAQHYSTLATPPEDNTMDGSVQAALAEAESAVDALAKGVSSSAITGVKTNSLALAQEAHTHGLNNDASAIARLAEAVQSHASAASSIADGAPDKAKHQLAEADSHRSIAGFQAQAAASYHDMVARNIKPASGDSAHSTNEDTVVDNKNAKQTGGRQQGDGKVQATTTTSEATTDQKTKEGDEVARKALVKNAREHHEKVAAEFEKFAKNFGDLFSKAKDSEQRTKLEDCKKAATDWAAQRRELAKSMGVIEEKLKDMAADKATDPSAGDMQSSPNPIGSGDEQGAGGGIHKADVKFKPNSKLIVIGPHWFDKKGNWFGKRDFSENKRKEMADSGAAMPDGSFPIANKEDVHNAVRLVGHSKNPDKAKAHIKHRAKAIGAEDALPDDWKGDDAKKAACEHEFGKGADAHKCMKCGFMQKKAPNSDTAFEGADPGEMDDEGKDTGEDKHAVASTNKGDDDPDDDKKGPEFRDYDADDPVAKAAHTKLMTKRVKSLAKAAKQLKKTEGNTLLKASENAITDARGKIANEALLLSQHPLFKSAVMAVGRTKGTGWLRQVAHSATVVASAKKPEDQEKYNTLVKRLTKLEKKIQKAEVLSQLAKGGPNTTANEPLKHTTASADTNPSGSDAEVGAGKATADSPAMTKMEQDLARAMRVVHQLTPMVKMVQDLRTEVAGLTAKNADLEDKLTKYGAQPMPGPRASVPHGLRAVDKTQDGNVRVNLKPEETQNGGLLKTVLDKVPAGRQRANALLELARSGN